MDTTKTMSQKRQGAKLTFSFSEEKLTFTLADTSGEKSFAVPYEAIDVFEPSTVTLQNLWLRRKLELYMALYFLITLSIPVMHPNPNGTWRALFLYFASVLVPLIVAGVAYHLAAARNWFATKCSVFGISGVAASNKIMVIFDKNHAAIVELLKARWRERLRKLHAPVNPANPQKAELAKFKWLKENGVISEAEYLAATSEIAAANDPADDARSEPKAAKRLNLN